MGALLAASVSQAQTPLGPPIPPGRYGVKGRTVFLKFGSNPTCGQRGQLVKTLMESSTEVLVTDAQLTLYPLPGQPINRRDNPIPGTAGVTASIDFPVRDDDGAGWRVAVLRERPRDPLVLIIVRVAASGAAVCSDGALRGLR